MRTVKRRYCAVCDDHYIAGEFAEHRASALHRACTAHRRAMALWYEANARISADLGGHGLRSGI